jgi:hypothetical protein
VRLCGRLTVFYPNPVQTTGDQSLADDHDHDSAAFTPAYHTVTLTDLDSSGTLTGRYITAKSETGKPAQAVNGAFPAWHRDSDQFEQIMGYYWVTTAQHYIQSLGFGTRLRPVNQHQIELRINQYGSDNSFYRDDKTTITLGKEGVDDAEDGEVIIHEYRHSAQDGQVTGFGTTLESGAIGEALGDYLAIAVSSWKTGPPTRTPETCVADWDSVSYTSKTPHCLRRLDGTKHYPQDLVGEVHADGEIWSSALYDIRTRLGDTLGSTVIIDAQFDFTKDTTFKAAAETTMNAAQRHGGDTATTTVRAAFTSRGLV